MLASNSRYPYLFAMSKGPPTLALKPPRNRPQGERQTLELSPRDSEAFVAALIDPPPVGDPLRDTLRRYRRATGV